MISTKQVNEIIDNGKLLGVNIRVRDIAFVLLSRQFDDDNIAYRCIFTNNDTSYDEYKKSDLFSIVQKEVDDKLSPLKIANKKDKNNSEDISFEENKAEILRLIKETRIALDDGKIEAKDALKIEADLRVKLNDKFNIQNEVKDQVVIVNAKYNSICSCGRELYIPTKDDLMKKYNLVEK